VEAIGGASDSVLYVVFVGLGLGAIDYYLGTGRVYCANDDSNSVSVIDPVSHHVIAVPAGHGPCALGYSTASNKVYCANGRDSTVTVIDGATNSVLKTMTVGASPIALTCNPVQNRVYVANYGSNSISVVRDSALDVAERATPTGRRLALEAEPNPFSGRISLRLTANGSRPEVRIYDVNGALVRSFPEIRDSPQRDSPRFLVWDGTDGMGRRLPTGVYVVRLTDGANCVQRKVLLLR
jgi:YVTN family beta-propeller protein